MKKALYTILLVIVLAVFLYSGWQLYLIIADYQAGSAAYSGLDQYLATDAVIAPQETKARPEDTEAEEETELKEPILVVDFEGLSQINPYVVGWIYLEDTQISYPVVQPHDNMAYLRRLFDGTYNNAGCIFMEEECGDDFTDYNNILYGHNMKNGTMFADLIKYKDQEYFDEHPEGYLLTPDKTYRVVFFSGYVCGTRDSAWNTNLTEETYPKWLEEITGKSTLETGVVPEVTDKILTLSTCSYEFSNARYILHGILVEE